MQYTLPFLDGAQHVAEKLKGRLGFAPKITLTDNRRSILSVRYKSGEPHLRLHRCFAGAPEDVLDAVAGFVKRRTAKRNSILGSFFESQNLGNNDPKQKRRRIIKTAGAHHDLDLILHDLNERFFGGSVDAGITWGRRSRRKKRWFRKSRHITLGSYRRHEKLIVIHPNLDKPNVPRCVVESIVFHEICHQVVGGTVNNDRRRIHTRQFKEQELKYPEFAKAKLWVKENMRYLCC